MEVPTITHNGVELANEAIVEEGYLKNVTLTMSVDGSGCLVIDPHYMIRGLFSGQVSLHKAGSPIATSRTVKSGVVASHNQILFDNN